VFQSHKLARKQAPALGRSGWQLKPSNLFELKIPNSISSLQARTENLKLSEKTMSVA
jgi:hypothetical protein